ncbi:MAG TPA: ABC transporter transmembrane domain-containing protein [Chloroflexia bacterium]|nr:ABC transporter transmembrane domain-containing protein [Chloroflexia bacterium]
MDASIDLGVARPVAPAWRRYPGKHVTVYAPEGSYAGKRAPAELHAAEQAADTLEKLLAPPPARRDASVAIYLSDPLAAPAAPALGAASGPDGVLAQMAATAIVRVVQPEAPGEPLIWPLTRQLVAAWYGSRAAAAPLLIDGIAGVAAARLGVGPSVPDAHAWVRSETAAGRPVTVLARLAPALSAPMESPAGARRAATSFVAFLIETFGLDAVRAFLAMYDPDRRDQAAVAAFQRPLGALEEAWRGGLRRPPPRGTAFRTFFRHLGPLLHPYRRGAIEVLIYMLGGLVYTLIMPLAGKYLVDTIIPAGTLGPVGGFILALFVLFVLNAGLAARRAYVTAAITQRVLIALQERMFAHLQQLAHNFYAEAKVGDIMARFGADLYLVQQALAQVASVGPYMALNAVAAAIILLVLQPLLGALVLGVVPLFAVIYLALRTRFQESSAIRQKLVGELVAAIQENLAAHTVVKAFAMEERAINAYHGRMLRMLRAGLRATVTGTLFETSTALAVTLGQLVVFGAGGLLVMQHQLTVGTLLAFIGLLPTLFLPVAALAGVGQTVESAAGALDRITELLEAPVTIADAPGAPALAPLTRAMTLDAVTFGYGGPRPVLQDLSLVIPAGAHLAIVGPSGSGKSTIANLLLRFWDPEGGRVCFDNQDLRTITRDSLRGQIGLVFQETFIFDTTVRENIAIGRPDATEAEIVAAARSARLDHYIAGLPAGYDTVLGERGVRMSGGQRQRLALARVLLRDAPILILDEATSALDAQTEREILDTLAAVTAGRTTISITHRLTLAALADNIVVLDGGRVVEQGAHARLVQAGGLYARLYAEQTDPASAGRLRVGVDAARLRTIPLFAGLHGAALAALADGVMREHYPAGADVVRQGEPGDKLYIIRRGQAEVRVADGMGARRVNTLDEGDYFGEMALLAGEPRSATVRTTQPTEFYSLAQADFAALLAQEPALGQAVAATVAGRRAALLAAAATLGAPAE